MPAEFRGLERMLPAEAQGSKGAGEQGGVVKAQDGNSAELKRFAGGRGAREAEMRGE